MSGAALEKKLKHLEMIQGVINRLASNSFRIKGWSVVLVTALLALSAQNGSARMALVSLIPVLVFWWLDGYYLSQERLFRALFDCVRAKDEVDFSMNAGPRRWRDWRLAVWSATLWPFYGALAAAALAGLALLGTTGDRT